VEVENAHLELLVRDWCIVRGQMLGHSWLSWLLRPMRARRSRLQAAVGILYICTCSSRDIPHFVV